MYELFCVFLSYAEFFLWGDNMIFDFQEISLEDYPGYIATICFTQGCQLRCPYCHNPKLVLNTSVRHDVYQRFLTHLQKRKGVVEGVVFTGGEPLCHDEIITMIRDVKELGLKVKLDTNGGFPKRLELLLNEGLIDYVALDFKGNREIIDQVVGLKSTKNYQRNWEETLGLLDGSLVEYELRTTVIKGIHTVRILKEMSEFLQRLINKSQPRWYLQRFRNTGDLLKDYTKQLINLESYHIEELDRLIRIDGLYPVQIR